MELSVIRIDKNYYEDNANHSDVFFVNEKEAEDG